MQHPAMNLNGLTVEKRRDFIKAHYGLDPLEYQALVDTARLRLSQTFGADDEIETDDFPFISEGEGGAWVGAWVWVPKASADDAA